MYIKQTFFGFAVYKQGKKIMEFASYNEAWQFIREKEKNYEK